MQILSYLKNLNASLSIKLHDVLKLPFYKANYYIEIYRKARECINELLYKNFIYVAGIWIRLILSGRSGSFGSGSFKNAIKF